MTLQTLSYYLWIGPHLLLGILAVVMLRRRLYRQFPIFFIYTLVEAVQWIVPYYVQRTYSLSSALYFNTFCIESLISTGLRFGILYEAFSQLFQDYHSFSAMGRNVFRWGGVSLLLAASILAVAVKANGDDRALLLMVVLARTVNILQCGLVLGVFLFSSYFRLSWKNQVFGIALGFGIYAGGELAAAAFRTQFSTRGSFYIDLLTFGLYNVCVLLWVFYVLGPDRKFQATVESVPEHDLETWNQELQRLLRQ